MIKYTIWDKKRTLYPPVGEKLTAEKVFEKWGWAENSACIVVISEIDGVLQSFDNLGILKQNYSITESDPVKAVALIEELLNAPPPPPAPPQPDASEAIVARLDYIIMMQEGV
jgi:hypothetical protein